MNRNESEDEIKWNWKEQKGTEKNRMKRNESYMIIYQSKTNNNGMKRNGMKWNELDLKQIKQTERNETERTDTEVIVF